jgi:hypothetical protein
MKLLTTISAIIFAFATYAQSTLFKVITSQGAIEVLTNGTSTKVSSGTRLNSGSTIKVYDNSYLGLIHISGGTIEVKKAGDYDVTKLAQQFATEQSSFTDKYANYVVSKVTSEDESKKNYSYTGAVTRGAESLVLWAPSQKEENIVKLLQTVPIRLNWGSVDGITEYKVTIKTFDETTELYTEKTSNNNILLDLSTVTPTTDAPYFVEIEAMGSTIAHSMKPFYLIDEKSSTTVTEELNQLKSKVDTESALGNLIVGSFYEENGFTMYAISSYQDAVNLEPNIKDYKDVRNIYFNNNEVLFEE